MESFIAILSPFFKRPLRAFHIREIAKVTRISHTAVRRYLKKLEKEEFLIKKPTKPYPTFSANLSSKKYLNLKLFYNLEKIRESGIVESLEHKLSYPTIVLFGSFAKALDDENSDVDICVLTDANANLDLKDFEKEIERPVSLHIFNRKKWDESKEKNPDMINNICNGIVLSGQIEVL